MTTEETLHTGKLTAIMILNYTNKITAGDNHVAITALAYALCSQSIATRIPGSSPTEAKAIFFKVLNSTYDQIEKTKMSM